MAWLYVPAVPVSNSVSILPLETITELSVTLKGKPTQPPSLQREWKKGGWIRHLSGMTLPPSEANRGVEKFISSLEAIPVSPSVWRESKEGWRTLATCGPTSLESSERFNPNGASSRTSPTISISDTVRCDVSWKKWVIALRKDSLRRLKLALHTSDSDFSSWRTPDANCGNRFGQHPERRNPYRTFTINDQVRAQWPTPRSSPNENRNTKPAPSHGVTHGKTLAGEAASWPTPTSRDWKDGNCENADVPTNGLLGRADGRSSLPVLRMPTGGANSSSSGRKLNPRFVEMLMNWPLHWSKAEVALDPINFVFWEMASSRLLQHLLSLPSINN